MSKDKHGKRAGRYNGKPDQRLCRGQTSICACIRMMGSGDRPKGGDVSPG